VFRKKGAVCDFFKLADLFIGGVDGGDGDHADNQRDKA
jgi:hypothetical protein